MFIEHLLCERLCVESWVYAVWWYSLAGYSPYGCKELDITEQLSKSNLSKPVAYYRGNCVPSRNIWQRLETFLVIMIVGVLSEWVKVTQSYLTLCDPVDFTVHGILQARILEWIAIPFSRRSSKPRDRTQVSCIAGRFFASWATREMLLASNGQGWC